jgi:hypothetical protein
MDPPWPQQMIRKASPQSGRNRRARGHRVALTRVHPPALLKPPIADSGRRTDAPATQWPGTPAPARQPGQRRLAEVAASLAAHRLGGAADGDRAADRHSLLTSSWSAPGLQVASPHAIGGVWRLVADAVAPDDCGPFRREPGSGQLPALRTCGAVRVPHGAVRGPSGRQPRAGSPCRAGCGQATRLWCRGSSP